MISVGLTIGFILTLLYVIFLHLVVIPDIIEEKNEILKDYNDMIKELPDIIKKNRQDALDRSRAVIKGQISENLAPFLTEFSSKYQASNARFLGNPIDYIIFNRKEVVLVEIKTGSSSLSTKQRMIRDLIEDGNFRFEVIRIE